jgi:O-antigen ligase
VIRYSLLVFAMLVIAALAAKNWFRALCFMLPLLAFLERPDMPREMLGITGLNPLNILLGIILVAWFIQRRYDDSHWSANKTITRLFIAYMVVLSISTIRAILDIESLQYYSILAGREAPGIGDLIRDSVFNDIKWLIVGLLICVGVQTERGVRFAVYGILLTSALLAVQIISRMLPGLVGADDLASRALRVLDRNIGYHRVALATIMAASAWAFLAAGPIIRGGFRKIVTVGGFGLCTLALVATGGRAGMMSWAACALVLGFLRWRKLLVLAPLAAILAVFTIPGLQDRLLEGFQPDEDWNEEQEERRAEMGAIDESGRDRYAITSGRVVVWPLVFDKAMESPIVGHGRIAMRRTGIVADLEENFGVTSFGHPHNAYLELFIDTGIVGLIIVGTFYWQLFVRSARASASPENDTQKAVASLVLAYLVVNLTASLGSQSFYPNQGAALFWITIGLAMSQLFSKHAEAWHRQPLRESAHVSHGNGGIRT